jgi:hypothetical protein
MAPKLRASEKTIKNKATKKPHLSVEKWGSLFHRHSLGKRLPTRKLVKITLNISIL